MTPRKQKPIDRRGVPPVIYPRLPCVGGPCDGEVRSWLDLPWTLAIGSGSAEKGGVRGQAGEYERRTVDGRDVWDWQERIV